MKVKNLRIDSIVQLDNSRSKIKQHELELLMASIKKDGLLQPIGVRPSSEYEDEWNINYGNRRLLACKKLGWEEIPSVILDEAENESDVIITNLIENEHRSDISDLERGRYFQELISDKYALTVGEIAIRVGISKVKVQQCIRLYNEIPVEFRKKVRTNKAGQKAKAGTIPVSLADQVLVKSKKLNFKKKQKEQLLNYCREDGVGKDKLNSIISLMSAGATFEKAKKKCDQIKMVTVSIPVVQSDWDEYIDYYGTADKVREAICKAMYGIEDNLQFQKPY